MIRFANIVLMRRTAPAACLLLVCWSACLPAMESAAERFRALYEREWNFRLAEFPMLATEVGDHRYDNRLGSITKADIGRRERFWRDILDELSRIDTARLNAAEQVDATIFRRQIESFLDDIRFKMYLMPLNSDSGFHSSLAMLPFRMPLATFDDFEHYLARLAALPRVFAEQKAMMRRGIELGYTVPRAILAGRDQTFAAHVLERSDDSVFYRPFVSRPSGVDKSEWPALQKRARAIIGEKVIPAWRDFLDFFKNEYVPAARETIAATDLPDGKAFYANQIRYYTTLPLDAETIHQMGLDEVARIRGEMQRIIDDLTARDEFHGDFAAFLKFLRTDARFYAATPRELLMTASYYAKRIDAKLPSLFGRLPRQPYGVAPVPDDIAPNYTGGRYVSAPEGGTEPGYFWVNTYDLKSRPLYVLPALTLHEAVPGHHLQIALAAEQAEQPPFRRYEYISAFGEGWGLYAEWLGVEAGIYETPYEHFGRLTYEMWRACRLVVDTGIHALGWNRTQAIDYLLANTALSEHEITTEVDRYIGWPAQALSYKIGDMTIKRLRREAESALGTRFDKRAFHDRILALGSVPLPILESAIRNFIAERQGGP